MRLTVVYNPRAGSRGWPRSAIEERLRAAGHAALLVSSKGDWKACLEEPTDAVVAAGGDGTVHKVARALAATDRPLAIVPLGTANNIARAFGHAPGSDPFGRVHDWGKEERPLLIECAQRSDDALPFLEVMGAGAFARLLVEDASRRKERLPLASLMKARKRLLDHVMEGPMLEAQATVDRDSIEGRYVMLACLRNPSFGPALWLAPEQRPDSRTMTLVGVRNDQRETFAWWLATGEGDVRSFELGRGDRIELTVQGPVHVDDRMLETEEVPVTVKAGGGGRRVRVLV